MRAEKVIATHGNTDFDAFAAMLAARRLYPGAVVGAARLAEPQRARVLPRCTPTSSTWSRPRGSSSDAIRRLIVVETVHASRLGELEPVALDAAVEKVVFDHHARRARPTGSRPSTPSSPRTAR